MRSEAEQYRMLSDQALHEHRILMAAGRLPKPVGAFDQVPVDLTGLADERVSKVRALLEGQVDDETLAQVLALVREIDKRKQAMDSRLPAYDQRFPEGRHIRNIG